MLYIVKRNGQKEAYNSEKIINAVRKSFLGTGSEVSEEELLNILKLTEAKAGIRGDGDEIPQLTVEAIQDKVEEALRAVQHYLIDEDKGLIKLLTPPFDKTQNKDALIDEIGLLAKREADREEPRLLNKIKAAINSPASTKRLERLLCPVFAYIQNKGNRKS